MELQYLTVLEENNVNERELPQDAKNGIKEIKNALRLAKLREAKGYNPENYYKKAKTFDKWVTYEIYDFINGTDNNEDIPEVDVEEEQNEKENQEQNIEKVAKGDGASINKELSELYKNGKTDLSINEIKGLAPNSYDTLFDCYEEGEQNGIQTSEYALIEYDEQKYKLTKI